MFNGGQIISESSLNIRIGTESRLSASYSAYKIKTLIVHENYNMETFENDIAMMKLKETLKFTENFRAICFSQLVELPEALFGTAVGYGSTDKSKAASDVLRQVEIPIVTHEECLDSDNHFFSKHLFSGNFCAGELEVERGVCSGDSGKVLTFTFESSIIYCLTGGGFYVRINNNWFLQGITSNTKESKNLNNPTCNFASYAIFTNVTFYAGWLES